MINKENILKALSNVIEPDLGKDLVSLNMIKSLHIENLNVNFDIELTTPACPMKNMMMEACVNAIHLMVDKNAVVKIGFTAQTKNANHSTSDILKGIKNIIAVFSGKGGVGKSTVASNLAVSLQKQGAKIGLFDADIYGPSVPIMFDVKNVKPLMQSVNGKNMIVPVEKYGIKLMSIGLLIDEQQAVVWRGPMASSAIRQFATDVLWDELDYLIIDMPPGTGDIHLTLLQLLPISGAVIVSTPQNVALADAKKAIAMFAQAQSKVPIIGIIENMAYFTPQELPQNKYYIFGKNGAQKLADDFELPFLGQIPLVQGICEASDKGNPIYNILQNDAPIIHSFDIVSKNIIRSLSMYLEKMDRRTIANTLK